MIVVYVAMIAAIIAFALIDLLSRKTQISNMIAALLLIGLGSTLILAALSMWLDVSIQTTEEYIAILTDDFMKVVGGLGLSTAGMSLITGGFSLIIGGLYELSLSSTEPISMIEVKK